MNKIIIFILTNIVYQKNLICQHYSTDQTFEIIFQDEFNGLTIDVNKWQVDQSTRVPNKITNNPSNVVVTNGNLECWAKNQTYNGFPYTEAAVLSKTSFVSGFFIEMRCKLAPGTYTNTGAWLWGGLHDNGTYCNNCFDYQGNYVNKKCGCQNYNEVDFYEYYGDVQESTGQYHTCHTNGNCVMSQGNAFKVTYPNDYHIVGFYRNPIKSYIYFDEKLVESRKTPINKSVKLVLYLWLRDYVNNSQPFPVKTLFDYVRVYRLKKDCNTVVTQIPNFNIYNYALKKSIKLTSNTIIPSSKKINLWAKDFIELGGGNTNFDIPVSNQEIAFGIGECW
jgi:hypothetical protein